MGFHICEYCGKLEGKPENRFSHLSSGDVTLNFTSGKSYKMPDMILHYVADHRWLPPTEFVNDVMNSELKDGSRMQFRSISFPISIGYLSGPFETGEVPEGFVERLESLMKQVSKRDT